MTKSEFRAEVVDEFVENLKIYTEQLTERPLLQDRKIPATPIEIARELQRICSDGVPGPYVLILVDKLIELLDR